MSRYLYITDVYCPWCYAFGLVFDKVLARYPMPVSVLCGELVSPGYTIDDMVMEMPNIRAFFKRLQDTAGRGVGKAYLDLLEPGKGSMSMDSRAMSVPVAALRRLDPGREREQIEALQKAFYQDGQDVLDPYVQAKACGVDEEALILECSRKEVQEQAEKDRFDTHDRQGHGHIAGRGKTFQHPGRMFKGALQKAAQFGKERRVFRIKRRIRRTRPHSRYRPGLVTSRIAALRPLLINAWPGTGTRLRSRARLRTGSCLGPRTRLGAWACLAPGTCRRFRLWSLRAALRSQDLSLFFIFLNVHRGRLTGTDLSVLKGPSAVDAKSCHAFFLLILLIYPINRNNTVC